MNPDVIIIGAGISGLACALAVEESGLTPLVLDASDAVGGRIRTDKKDGFLLDRGFQVLQTWYPEARRILDYAALDLRPFDPGALVRFAGRFHRVTDVWRRPSRLLQMAISPVATPADKLRMLTLRRRALNGDLKTLYERPESDALTRLQELSFSPRIIERFFKPFFAGVFYEPDLAVSSRAFEFVFRAFALGDTALPARGMGEIPAQLAATLPPDSIRLQARVRQLLHGQVVLENGERLRAPALVIATDAREAARLLGEDVLPETRGTTCFYFAAEQPPFPGPDLALNGEGVGLINSLLVPSNLSEHYAPPWPTPGDRQPLGYRERSGPDRAPAPQRAGRLVRRAGKKMEAACRLSAARRPSTTSPAVALSRRARCSDTDRLWICSERGGAPSIQWALHSGSRAGQSVCTELLGLHRSR